MEQRISLSQMKESIAKTRKQLLDVLELAFGDHHKWPAVRSFVLRSLGENGLDGIIDDLNETSPASNTQTAQKNRRHRS
jgi:hypothetical protein